MIFRSSVSPAGYLNHCWRSFLLVSYSHSSSYDIEYLKRKAQSSYIIKYCINFFNINFLVCLATLLGFKWYMVDGTWMVTNVEHWWNYTERGKSKARGEKPVSVPTCPPQMPHELHRPAACIFTVKGRRLSAYIKEMNRRTRNKYQVT